MENIKLHFGKSVFLLAKLHWFFINSRRLCTWTKTFSKWNRVFVKRLLDFWYPVYLVHLKNLHIWLKIAKCSVSNTLTKSKWMRRCFEPHISPPVVLYFCVFTIFQQNVFKHFIYYDIKWTKTAFWKNLFAKRYCFSINTRRLCTWTNEYFFKNKIDIFRTSLAYQISFVSFFFIRVTKIK